MPEHKKVVVTNTTPLIALTAATGTPRTTNWEVKLLKVTKPYTTTVT